MASEGAETSPLLGLKQRSSNGRIRHHFAQRIRVHNAYLPLLVCCFTTGLIDAASYNAWQVFMGMQTGNTIFLALSTAGLPAGSDGLKWARSGISILSLMVGSTITGRISVAVGPTRRVTLFTSFMAQTLCIAVAAILVHSDTVPEETMSSKLVLIAIPFLAIQSGAQIVTAKSLGFNELPTTVLTNVYSDLGSDTSLGAVRNSKRNRRVGAVAMILLGGISGGWLSRTGQSLTLVLWLGALIKLMLGFSWLFFAEDLSG